MPYSATLEMIMSFLGECGQYILPSGVHMVLNPQVISTYAFLVTWFISKFRVDHLVMHLSKWCRPSGPRAPLSTNQKAAVIRSTWAKGETWELEIGDISWVIFDQLSWVKVTGHFWPQLLARAEADEIRWPDYGGLVHYWIAGLHFS